MKNVQRSRFEKQKDVLKSNIEMGTLEAKTPRVRLTPLCLQKRLREFKINFPKKLNTKQFYKN